MSTPGAGRTREQAVELVDLDRRGDRERALQEREQDDGGRDPPLAARDDEDPPGVCGAGRSAKIAKWTRLVC
jgi:hypothetical protein